MAGVEGLKKLKIFIMSPEKERGGANYYILMFTSLE